ncbi:glycosyltransferase, partial [Leptospira sp. SA-E8]|uniref:glycosyltransferase n=1 Tax=Leptospira sp. SA-E8 TaxID=3422259 RepID=UPI003EB999DA
QFVIALLVLVHRFKPDVVHLHSSFAGALGRVALFLARPFHRCLVVYSPHAFAFTMDIPEWKRKTYSFIERVLLKVTDALICTSQHELDVAVRFGLNRNKLHLIHNGVPDPHAERSISDGVDNTVLQLLFVGRFDHQKGFDVLREAMNHLQGRSIRLVAIGAAVHGHETPAPHPQIEYVGWVKHSELARYYRASHLLVMPSRWEGFAMTPLEALSHGLPVLASSHPSFNEVVIPNVSGDRFPSGDAITLANKIRSLRPLDCLAMRESSYQHFLVNFRDTAMTDATFSMYQNIRPVKSVTSKI